MLNSSNVKFHLVSFVHLAAAYSAKTNDRWSE